jgi:hypothetical protein
VPENDGMRQSSVDVIRKGIKAYLERGAIQPIEGKASGEGLCRMFRLLAVCHTVVVEQN